MTAPRRPIQPQGTGNRQFQRHYVTHYTEHFSILQWCFSYFFAIGPMGLCTSGADRSPLRRKLGTATEKIPKKLCN